MLYRPSIFSHWRCPWTLTAPSTLFLAFRRIWGSQKWSHMIPHVKNMGLDTKVKCLAWPEATLQLFDTFSKTARKPFFHLGLSWGASSALQPDPKETYISEFLTKNYFRKWPQSPGTINFTDFFWQNKCLVEPLCPLSTWWLVLMVIFTSGRIMLSLSVDWCWTDWCQYW